MALLKSFEMRKRNIFSGKINNKLQINNNYTSSPWKHFAGLTVLKISKSKNESIQILEQSCKITSEQVAGL